MDKKEFSEYMRGLGKKGGLSTIERYGKEHMANLSRSRKGMSWTWAKGKKPKKIAKGLQSQKEGDKIG